LSWPAPPTNRKILDHFDGLNLVIGTGLIAGLKYTVDSANECAVAFNEI